MLVFFLHLLRVDNTSWTIGVVLVSLWKLILVILIWLSAQATGCLASGERLTETLSAPVALPLVPSSGGMLPDGGLLQWATARLLHSGLVPGVESAIKPHNRMALTATQLSRVAAYPRPREQTP
jgi:hypothetical protein